MRGRVILEPLPMTAFASLPMYDWPELSGNWDRLWSFARTALGGAGIETEERLRRPADHEAEWTKQDLCIGQTCGWPFVSRLSGKVIPFARFDFGIGKRPGDYRSVFISGFGDRNASDILADATATIAVNDFNSQSGFRALSTLAQVPMSVPRQRFLVTGSHRKSIEAVAGGLAHLAAIDGQSWRYARALEPAAQDVHVLGISPDVPGLPLITSPAFSRRIDAIYDALEAAINAMDLRDRTALGIAGLVHARAEEYAVLKRDPYGRVAILA
jgi:ABC-type phosphate/phosphonate transport system substrate-binding protein